MPVQMRFSANLLRDSLTLILAGGRGERLFPLTRDRTKGAVPFGGLYRLIDFTLSNCVNSGLRRIGVLPQYKFESLKRHLQLGWDFFRPEWGQNLTLIPPQQRVSDDWYRGTADAVYQNLYTLSQEEPSCVLILSADHVYRMDYSHLLDYHFRRGAEITVACIPVPLKEASRFGIMKVDPADRIIDFEEKPAAPSGMADRPGFALASMGIYVFTTDALTQVLSADARRPDSRHDFGRDIIPWMVEQGRNVFAFDVVEETGDRGYYWKDIGVIDAYWEANMELLSPDPSFDLYDPDWPVRTCQPHRPPARFLNGDYPASQISDSLLCPGVTVDSSRIECSILSPGVSVGSGAEVIDSVLMDGVQVGPGARLQRVIIDKGVRVPAGERIGLDPDADQARFQVSPGGIAVIPKGETLLSELAFPARLFPSHLPFPGNGHDKTFPLSVPGGTGEQPRRSHG